MKTYFIDKIGNQKTNITVTSVNELATTAIRFAEHNGGYISKIYVHCSQIITGNTTDNVEFNTEYIINVNNRKRTITVKRV